MNKKEIAEIRKLFKMERCAITRICGCYVNGDKEKVATFRESFLSLEEEESLKYFELFKKGLSGSLGRNLFNMEFPLATEEEGGTQAFLLAMRDSHLQDDTLTEAFYDKVIASYGVPDNYLILLIHQVYDVPGKSSAGDEMFDASDEVFDHIFCFICPVTLSKGALSYDGEEHLFHSRVRDWIVDKPAVSFLFPAFNDRASDIHSLLYYTAKASELHSELIDSLLGTVIPMSAENERDAFTDLVEETLGEDCDYEVVQNLHQQLHEIAEKQKEIPEVLTLSKVDVRDLLESSGADPEQMEHFDEKFEELAGDSQGFTAVNVMSTKRFEVKTADISVAVSPDRSDLVEQRIIDGRPCLVIPITDDMTVNGLRVTPVKNEVN